MRAAAEKQMKKLWHTTNIYVHPSLHEYCDKLASYLPDPLKVSWIGWIEARGLKMMSPTSKTYTGLLRFPGDIYHQQWLRG